MPPQGAAATPNKRDRFLHVFQQLKGEVLADDKMKQADAAQWMERMMDYNVPGGKLNRGLSVKDTLMAVNPQASAEEQLQADRIGWAIELLQVCNVTSLTTHCARRLCADSSVAHAPCLDPSSAACNQI